MHRFFFTTKDATINSGSNSITGEDFTDKNVGQDEVLELKKIFFNREFHYPTRVLLQFDADEIETFISSSEIYKGSYKTNLSDFDNAPELFAEEDIDGGLIGGAALEAADFLAICRTTGN